MPWNARAGLVLPVVITAAVLLLGNCGTDELPTDATGASGSAKQAEGAAPRITGANHPDTKLLVFPGDTSTEKCEPGERCVIQGQSYENIRKVVCSTGPGNCGTGNFQWSLLNPPPSSTVTFNPPITAFEQETHLTIETDSATSSGVHPSISRATVVSGTAGSPPDFPYPIRVLCSSHYNHCPEIEIFDINKNKVVTDSTVTTAIGQQNHVSVRYKAGTGSGSYSIEHVEWTMTGDSLVRDYIMGTSSTLTWLDQGSLDDSTDVRYYYSLAQNGNTVHVKATVRGTTGDTQHESTATYNAVGPTFVSAVSATIPGGPVAKSYTGTAAPKYLRFGEALYVNNTVVLDSLGIYYTFNATPPSGIDGEYGITQLLNGAGQRIPTTGWIFTTSLEFQLDNCTPLAKVPSDSMLTWGDPPQIPLSFSDTLAGMAGVFDTYLMYKPEGPSSIWVPIGILEWAVGAVARTTYVPEDYFEITQSAWTVNPSGTSTSTFPTWSNTMPGGGGCPSQ